MERFALVPIVAITLVCPTAKSEPFLIEPGSVYKVWPAAVLVGNGITAASGEAPDKVSGDFVVRWDPRGDPPLFRIIENGTGTPTLSKGVTGGACLIHQSASTPKPCATDGDCDTLVGLDGTPVDKNSGYSWYCASPEADGDPVPAAAQKTCWYKKSDAACLKSPVDFLPQDKRIPLPKVSAFPYGSGHPVVWRVVTCQNLVEFGCMSGGTEGIEFEFRFGPIGNGI